MFLKTLRFRILKTSVQVSHILWLHTNLYFIFYYVIIFSMYTGSHLADHCPDGEKADAMRMRLAALNAAWDSVCERAAEWQTRLQTALLEVK